MRENATMLYSGSHAPAGSSACSQPSSALRARNQREAVLRRGARLDESAPGSGLGLSIVDELAKAYGGSVTLNESSWGGLKVELRLPLAET